MDAESEKGGGSHGYSKVPKRKYTLGQNQSYFAWPAHPGKKGKSQTPSRHSAPAKKKVGRLVRATTGDGATTLGEGSKTGGSKGREKTMKAAS